MRRRGAVFGMALTGIAAGCGGGEGGGAAPPDTLMVGSEPRVEMSVYAPDSLGWNQADSVRVEVRNGTGEAVSGLRLRVTTGAGLVLLVAPHDSAAVLPLADLPAGQADSLAFAVRLPPAPGRPDSASGPFALRVELLPVGLSHAARVHVRAGSAVVEGGCATVAEPTAQRYGIGPVRVGMRAAALRAACPEARDTTWPAEGMPQAGLIVRPGGVPVLAEVAADTVFRIAVQDPRVRTPVGLGVGSSLADLRRHYGRGCPAAGEGDLFVLFQNAPGISFELDSLSARAWFRAGAGDAPVPDSARVAGLAIHGFDHPCPAPTE